VQLHGAKRKRDHENELNGVNAVPLCARKGSPVGKDRRAGGSVIRGEKAAERREKWALKHRSAAGHGQHDTGDTARLAGGEEQFEREGVSAGCAARCGMLPSKFFHFSQCEAGFRCRNVTGAHFSFARARPAGAGRSCDGPSLKCQDCGGTPELLPGLLGFDGLGG
jgi:hypothetical protein